MPTKPHTVTKRPVKRITLDVTLREVGCRCHMLDAQFFQQSTELGQAVLLDRGELTAIVGDDFICFQLTKTFIGGAAPFNSLCSCLGCPFDGLSQHDYGSQGIPRVVVDDDADADLGPIRQVGLLKVDVPLSVGLPLLMSAVRDPVRSTLQSMDLYGYAQTVEDLHTDASLVLQAGRSWPNLSDASNLRSTGLESRFCPFCETIDGLPGFPTLTSIPAA